MSSEPAIETLGLTRRFGDNIAVDNLNLAVQQGDVYGFVGPNGAGKTTTIRLLLGLVDRTSGEIRLFGSPVRRGRAQLGDIGAMVERPGLYPHLTSFENVKVFARLGGTRVDDHEIRRVLDAAGLDWTNRTPVRRYSSGMRQRLALALALTGRPRLVILDEPTDGLDPVGIVDVRTAIASLAERGATVFLSSHLLSEVERICSRIGMLVNGRLVRDATLDEVRRDASQWVMTFDGEESTAKAIRHLGELGIPAFAGATPHEAVIRERGVDVRAVRSTLASAGLSPTQVIARQRSLEELFLDLAGQARSGLGV